MEASQTQSQGAIRVASIALAVVSALIALGLYLAAIEFKTVFEAFGEELPWLTSITIAEPAAFQFLAALSFLAGLLAAILKREKLYYTSMGVSLFIVGLLPLVTLALYLPIASM